MINLSEAWKNKSVFNHQLKLNIKEISSKSLYPQHWNEFISLVKKANPKSILDIGCGCGTYYKLCDIELKGLKYVGIDYAQEAIDLAVKQWGYNDFHVMDYKQLTKEYVSNFDLLHLCGFLAILPNGDDALDFLLSLQPKKVIIGKIKITDKPSYYDTYKAYDEITTCEYYHNRNFFNNTCEKYRYKTERVGDSFLLNYGGKL